MRWVARSWRGRHVRLLPPLCYCHNPSHFLWRLALTLGLTLALTLAVTLTLALTLTLTWQDEWWKGRVIEAVNFDSRTETMGGLCPDVYADTHSGCGYPSVAQPDT